MRVGIIGGGAVGLALASNIYKVCKDDIYLLALGKYYENLKNGVIVNDIKYNIKVTSDLKMDYILVCVKNYDLDTSLEDMRVFVNDDTKILPLLNGIVAHDIVKKKYPNNIVYYGMIRIEANKIAPTSVNASKVSELAFGNEWNKEITPDVQLLKDIFDKSGINNTIYEDMKRAVWRKWMLNIGINQVSALTNSTYLDMHDENLQKLLYNLMSEIVMIASYEGINLTMDDVSYFMKESLNWSSKRVTSLTMDIINKRKNELDYFGLTAINLAKKHGIKVPYNETMYYCLKAITNRYLKENVYE
ncbi:MAG: ketopantoate reductase family protein [Anaeroplasmataceae bacterium]